MNTFLMSMHIRLLNLLILLLSTSAILSSCSNERQKKKIVYINSYHQGHPSSDEIQQGFMDNMPKDSFEIHNWYMDTKRNSSDEYIEKKAAQLLDSIDKIKPDLLVISDDNAVKYIAEPNLDQLSMPIIYCGVNWSADNYKLPEYQVTGILEILPVADALKTIKAHDPDSEKLLVLSENTNTSRKDEQILDTLFQRMGFKVDYKLVDNFEQWKQAYKEGNNQFDLIYIPTNAAIKGWDQEAAVAFIEENIKVPSFTCEDFMMPYVVLGVTKVAAEHGIWAATNARKLLSGKASIADIPVTKNQQANYYFNYPLAEEIDFIPDSALVAKAEVWDQKSE